MLLGWMLLLRRLEARVMRPRESPSLPLPQRLPRGPRRRGIARPPLPRYQPAMPPLPLLLQEMRRWRMLLLLLLRPVLHPSPLARWMQSVPRPLRLPTLPPALPLLLPLPRRVVRPLKSAQQWQHHQSPTPLLLVLLLLVLLLRKIRRWKSMP